MLDSMPPEDHGFHDGRSPLADRSPEAAAPGARTHPRPRRWIVWLTTAAVAIGAWALVGYPIYEFPAPAPFRGTRFFNPYERDGGRWLKANFHAHASAWLGITNGRASESDVARTYAAMGYDIVGLSNYWRISRTHSVPRVYAAYEHGANLGRSHHLVIGAHSVLAFDFPLVQNIHQKQFLLRLLHDASEVLLIAHPRLRGGFSSYDVARLTNYDGMEAVSGIRKSQEWWDAALSAGRLRWNVSGDDSHDSSDPTATGVCWTMIRAASIAESDVLAAISQGLTYGVEGKGGRLGIALDECLMHDGTLRVRTVPAASTITFIGQGGVARQTVAGVSQADYVFRDDDTYIRVEIEGEGNHLYLNPVVRTDGGRPDTAEARVNWPLSIGMWLSYTIAGVGIIAAAARWSRRRASGRMARSRTPQ